MGDLSDPWVVSIAEALARCAGIVQVHCPGDLPDRPFEPDRPPRLIVIHRHRFTAVDAQRLKEYRGCPGRRRVHPRSCCVSARMFGMKSWNAGRRWRTSSFRKRRPPTSCPARQPAGREARRPVARGRDGRLRIEVAGGNHDLCQAVVEACTAAGYRTHPGGRPRNRGDAGAANPLVNAGRANADDLGRSAPRARLVATARAAGSRRAVR